VQGEPFLKFVAASGCVDHAGCRGAAICFLVCRVGRLAGCIRCDSRVHLDPGCGDLSDYLLDCRGRISDFIFRVDVCRMVWVAPKARLAS
jgi:hypothetical protein